MTKPLNKHIDAICKSAWTGIKKDALVRIHFKLGAPGGFWTGLDEQEISIC